MYCNLPIYHNGRYLYFSKSRYIFALSIKINNPLKYYAMIKVAILRYRKSNGNYECLHKEFKTSKSFFTYLRKLNDSPRYGSVEWTYDYNI